MVPNNPEIPLDELLLRARCGDGEAQTQFSRRTNRGLLGYIGVKVKDTRLRNDVEDLGQDVLLKILDPDVTSFEPCGEPALWGWLRLIANRHVIDRLRSAKSGCSLDDLQIEPEPKPKPGPDVAEWESLWSAALDTLPEQVSQVVVLRAAGQTLAEVAKYLGMTLDQAKKASVRARSGLEKYIRLRRPEWYEDLRSYLEKFREHDE